MPDEEQEQQEEQPQEPAKEQSQDQPQAATPQHLPGQAPLPDYPVRIHSRRRTQVDPEPPVEPSVENIYAESSRCH